MPIGRRFPPALSRYGPALLLAGSGAFFLLAGARRAAGDHEAQASAVALVQTIAGDAAPDSVTVLSSVVREPTARVRLTLRDGDDHLKVLVRLRRENGRWIGQAVDFPDLPDPPERPDASDRPDASRPISPGR